MCSRPLEPLHKEAKGPAGPAGIFRAIGALKASIAGRF